jgi:hypothetical protein
MKLERKIGFSLCWATEDKKQSQVGTCHIQTHEPSGYHVSIAFRDQQALLSYQMSGNTEAQRSQVTCLRPDNKLEERLGL